MHSLDFKLLMTSCENPELGLAREQCSLANIESSISLASYFFYPPKVNQRIEHPIEEKKGNRNNDKVRQFLRSIADRKKDQSPKKRNITHQECTNHIVHGVDGFLVPGHVYGLLY